MLLKEADLSMESLRKAVRRLLEDSDFRETMKKNLEDIEIPEAADILAAEVSLLTGLGGGRPC
jgi:UDP-N-acetylglucosamine:LPS N-acetylglucosamine transferase